MYDDEYIFQKLVYFPTAVKVWLDWSCGQWQFIIVVEWTLGLSCAPPTSCLSM